jgi:hypothetical protein
MNLASLNLSHILSFAGGGLLVLGMTTVSQSHAQSPGHVYELRMYHTNEGKLDAVVARFRDHTVDIFKRHNMKSIGYFVPQDSPDSKNLLIYVLEHPSRAEADKNWAAFQADPEWQKVRAASEANGALVAKIDRYFMNPTDFSALK